MVNLSTILSVPLVTVASGHVHEVGLDPPVGSDVCVQQGLAVKDSWENGFTCSIPLQVGFMNNGVIKAADVEYYINGGCTPDESELVNKRYAFPISYQFSCTCHPLFAWTFLFQMDKLCEEFELEIKFRYVVLNIW